MLLKSMSKTAAMWGAVALISLPLAASAHAQDRPVPDERDGFVERLGERVDRGIERLSSEALQGWEALRKSVDRFGVQARVYSRLRWDKAIATANIKVDVEEEGVVLLSGEVRDAQAKRKAVELATDTIDVIKVVDQLTVRAATER